MVNEKDVHRKTFLFFSDLERLLKLHKVSISVESLLAGDPELVFNFSEWRVSSGDRFNDLTDAREIEFTEWNKFY